MLAALRARLTGVPAAQAVERYLPQRSGAGRTARGVLGDVRREVVSFARSRARADVADAIGAWQIRTLQQRTALELALEEVRYLPVTPPLLGDPLSKWLPPRLAAPLQAQGLTTLAELTLRAQGQRDWWSELTGVGPAAGAEVQGFFAANPELTERARELVERILGPGEIVPLERQAVRRELAGSAGRFRAPADTCLLTAANDKEAVEAWLQLHESSATQRAYRKEAERLILWAVVERGKPLSSLTTEDAVAYRAFLRHPAPRARWVGPARPRWSRDWRPFQGDPSSNSIGYAMSVLAALFRWLVDQRYVLANPFAGIKVRGAERGRQLDASRAFTQAEWGLVRQVAEGLEVSYGWEPAAAQRLRFVLDFAYATGLRSGELVSVRLGQIREEGGQWWLYLQGKGAKAGKVAVPPLGRSALQRHLVQRGSPWEPHQWDQQAPLISALGGEGATITGARLWAITRRFFRCAAAVAGIASPALGHKLERASPHWMRHTHASHALAGGAELVTVRDNLRHASIATTSVYLHSDEIKRGQQLAGVFGAS